MGEDPEVDVETAGVDLLFADVPELTRSWTRSKVLLKEFPPVCWTVWRLCKFVFGQNKGASVPPVGLLMGTDRVIGSLCLNDVLGLGGPMESLGKAVSALDPSIIGATFVLHNICRRLSTKDLKNVWATMLDDALVRARIGLELARGNPDFSLGRGMLAGFSGRIGMVVLIASGNHQQASQCLQRLASGGLFKEVGMEVYGIDPNHVTAQILILAGLGQDPAVGTLAFGNDKFKVLKEEQNLWRAAMVIIDASRMLQYEKIDEEDWARFDLAPGNRREEFRRLVKGIIGKGHDWDFIL
jgi:hypothetical protein